MRKLLVVLLFLGPLLTAQTKIHPNQIDFTRPWPHFGVSLPATPCTDGVLFFRTTDSPGLYQCLNQTWVSSEPAFAILPKSKGGTGQDNSNLIFPSSGTLLTTDGLTAQVNADWAATSGAAQILNKPILPWVAVSYLPGKPAAGATVSLVKLPMVVNFPAGLVNSQVSVGVNPTATATYSLQKNGVEFGTLAIASSGTATWTGTATTFAVGDVFRIVAPTSQDATLADVSISAYALR
jgi:hypothetical protein